MRGTYNAVTVISAFLLVDILGFSVCSKPCSEIKREGRGVVLDFGVARSRYIRVVE